MPRLDPDKVPWNLPEVVVCAAIYWAIARWLSQAVSFQGVSLAGGTFLFHLLISLPLVIFPILIVGVFRRRVMLDSLFPAGTAMRDAALGIQLFFIIGLLNAFATKLHLQALAEMGELHRLGGLQRKLFDLERVREVLLMAVAIGVIVPVCEEVFFRGFLYPALRRQFPAWLSIPLNSVIFAGFHWDVSMWPTAFLLSLVVCILFEYSGSLVGPILVHMGANLSFVMFLVDGGDLALAMPYYLIFGAFILMNFHFFISSRHLFRIDSPEEKDPGPLASDPAPDAGKESPVPVEVEVDAKTPADPQAQVDAVPASDEQVEPTAESVARDDPDAAEVEPDVQADVPPAPQAPRLDEPPSHI